MEPIKLQGWVIIKAIDKNGNIVDIDEGPNLITNAGKLNAERLLAGTIEGKPYAKIVFGTSGTAPDPTDTSITNPLEKDIINVSFAAGNVVVLETVIPETDPDMTIREVGVLNQNGVLCHRKVFEPAKVKVSGLAYHITYKVKVV